MRGLSMHEGIFILHKGIFFINTAVDGIQHVLLPPS